MKTGFYIAAALIGGALLAHLLLADPGYVAIRFAGHLVEMSAVTFVLLAIAAWFLVRWLWKLLHVRSLWRESQRRRREDRARKSLSQGLLEMSEGEWSASEQTLTSSARDAASPAAHYLVAARAADLQGAGQRRDELIAKAVEASGDRRAPALIMQAEMHLKHKQYQAALETLHQLEASGEGNARAIMLTARILRQIGDWERLQALEPKLRSTRGVTAAFADETVAQLYLNQFQAHGRAGDFKAVAQAWKDLPKSLSQRAEILVAYARAAMACGEEDAAEAELRRFLSRQWDESAVLVYGELETEEPLVTLERAEQWLPEHAEDAALLFTCARHSIRAELYGKARSYLETSLAIRPRLEAWQLLASLFEQLGERERAVKALNDAVTHAVGRRPRMPKIRARRWIDRRQADRRRN